MGHSVCARAPVSTLHWVDALGSQSQPVPQADSVVCASQAASLTRYVDMEASWQSEEVVSREHFMYGDARRDAAEPSVVPVPYVYS